MNLRFWIAAICCFPLSGAPSVQDMLDAAWRAGKKTLTIPPGIYRVSPPEQGAHLRFHGIEDFEVDARGVTLVFTDNRRAGIEFRDCRNVQFGGATLGLERLPFTQGVVEAIARDGRFYDIRIEKGYPANFDDAGAFPPQPVGYLFDSRTRWWKRGIVDNSGSRIERLGPDRFRVYWKRPMGPPLQPAAVGDLIGFRGIGSHNVMVLNCARMELTGLTIHSAGMFAVLERGGDGGNRYSIAVKRGPRPPGAETDPLFSSTADAFHSVGMRRGPVVENCYFEAMPDDGVAIHGTYSFVLDADGGTLVINNNSFRPGDPLRLFDPFGKPAGEAVVKSVAPLPDYQNAKKSRREARVDQTGGPYFRVTLDRTLPAGFDYLAANPSALGSGYVVRNNTIRNHRARGMLLKADDGLVEGNTIDGSTMGGIVITPEFWWNEACYSRNVTIRNNTVRNVAYWQRQWAGIVIAALDKEPVPAGGHRQIVLEGNTIENVVGTNLFISSASGVSLRRNRFVGAQQENVPVLGERWGADPGSLIFVTQADGVAFEGNTVTDRGPYGKAVVQHTATARISFRTDVALAPVFADGMVLQRNQSIAVWGTAGAGEQVSVRFRGKEVKTRAESGRWLVRIDAGPAGGPFEMLVRGANEIRLRNILVGEVWLASGQSNMVYTLGRPNIPPDVLEEAREMARQAQGAIRYFVVKPRGSDGPLDDVIGTWKAASPENITDVSAVAWYFVAALRKNLEIPVGLIVSSVGNTPAEAWLPQSEFDATSVAAAIWKRHRDKLAAVPPDAAARYKQEMAVWLKANNTPALQFVNARSHPVPPYTATDSHVPCRFYNGMIHGLAPYTLRGIIWYQGDSNAEHAREYPELIKALINSWRVLWKAELPFYYVEINNVREPQKLPVEEAGNLALIREMQSAALELPATGVVCAIDLLRPGDDVHFPIKKPVGDRLAGVVLSEVYARPVGLVRSPEYAGHTVAGNQVRLRFRFAEGLRALGDGTVRGFAIRGSQGDWVWAQGRIEGREILVWNSEVPQPVAVRYAWASNPIVSVENGSGLPLRPFRTDR